MTIELSDKFEEPSKENIDIGGYLVETIKGKTELCPILAVGDNIICHRWESEGWRIGEVYFKDAIVLKKDGTYLVGKEVRVLRYPK